MTKWKKKEKIKRRGEASWKRRKENEDF